MDKKEILEVHNFRFACKEFDPNKKISQDDFKTILEVGRLSPSSVGLEPWKFLIIQNNDLREKMIPFCSGAKTQIKTASHFIIILARRPKSLTPDSDYANYIFNEVKKYPTEITEKIKSFIQNFQSDLNDEEIFMWSCKQTYIALANMLTAAAQMKIDSCPIEGFSVNKIEELLISEGILNKQNFGVSCMAAFGYRNKPSDLKTRRELSEVTQWII